MRTRKLVFNGYIVDTYTSAFRKFEKGRSPEFIPFNSSKGRAMLWHMVGATKKSREWKTKDYVFTALTALTGLTLSAVLIGIALR